MQLKQVLIISVALIAIVLALFLNGTIASLVGRLIQIPTIRKTIWKVWYDYIATFHKKESNITFMNYGFIPLSETEEESMKLTIKENDVGERLNSNLYHAVVSEVKDQISGSVVLEVGAGRGGGASFITRYFNPRNYTGMDYSERAVALSSVRHSAVQGLTFAHGDAENNPFENESFDFVLNVESSHCYANVEKFFAESYRVLKTGGYFLMADFRGANGSAQLIEQLQSLPWKKFTHTDITSNVLAALDADDVRKRRMIAETIPLIFQNLMGEFQGVSGGAVHEGFKQRTILYHRFSCQK
eukprot:gene27750-36572_t